MTPCFPGWDSGPERKKKQLGQFTKFGWSLWIGLVVWYECGFPDVGGYMLVAEKCPCFGKYILESLGVMELRSSAWSPEVREKLMERYM